MKQIILIILVVAFVACRKKETEEDYKRIIIGYWVLSGQKRFCYDPFPRFSNKDCKNFSYKDVYFKDGTWVTISTCIVRFDTNGTDKCNVIEILPWYNETGVVCKYISDTLPYYIEGDKLYRYRHESLFLKHTPIVLDIFKLKKISKNKQMEMLEIQIEPENENAMKWFYNNNDKNEMSISNYTTKCRYSNF